MLILGWFIMLKELRCSLFKKQLINFHNGLNIILGDDDAKNSIGKSSALIAIDFIHGGVSLLEDKSGAIRAMGHHHYDFKFAFFGKNYFFSRSTAFPEIVHVCDEKYTNISDISIEDFRKQIKEIYNLQQCEKTFRFLVGPFSRIWGKGGIDSDHPFLASVKELNGTGIERLVDLFGHSEAIAVEKNCWTLKRNDES